MIIAHNSPSSKSVGWVFFSSSLFFWIIIIIVAVVVFVDIVVVVLVVIYSCISELAFQIVFPVLLENFCAICLSWHRIQSLYWRLSQIELKHAPLLYRDRAHTHSHIHHLFYSNMKWIWSRIKLIQKFVLFRNIFSFKKTKPKRTVAAEKKWLKSQKHTIY